MLIKLKTNVVFVFFSQQLQSNLNSSERDMCRYFNYKNGTQKRIQKQKNQTPSKALAQKEIFYVI